MKNIWDKIPEEKQGMLMFISFFLLVIWCVWSIYSKTI